MNVNLHIERLVLEGLRLNRADALLIERAMQTELTRLLAERVFPTGFHASEAAPFQQGAPVRMEATENPSRLGVTIAQSVYGAVTKCIAKLSSIESM